jgi:cobalt-zinc-cadmium efflux system membrane fusion protein
MTESGRAGLRSTSWPSRVRTILALTFIGLPSIAMAEDTVRLSPEQATSLGVRVVHPVASPTDKTLPYPAQIVIPTPQLWVVSSPVAGMVTGLSVARGDRVSAGQPLVVMESPSFVSQQREYMQAVAQEALTAQQLTRNVQLFQSNAVPQRILEASQTEARQANIVVAERRQMLRLSGLSDDGISKLTTEAAINATLSVVAPRSATVVDIMISPGQRMEQSSHSCLRYGSRSPFRRRTSVLSGRARRRKLMATQRRGRSCWFRKPPMPRPKPYWSGRRSRTPASCGPDKPPKRASALLPRPKVPGRFPTAR